MMAGIRKTAERPKTGGIFCEDRAPRMADGEGKAEKDNDFHRQK